MEQIKDKKITYHQKKDTKLLIIWDCFRYYMKMKYQKITGLLDTTSDNIPKFITKIWIKVHDQSRGSYNIDKQIKFKTSMLQSDLCDYSDAYIVVKGTITVQTENNIYLKMLLKNNAPFINCISKISELLIDNAEDLDIVMTMWNLIEYSKNYSKISDTSWNYTRHISPDPITNHLIKPIYYLSCHLKLKKIEHLFQSIIHQKLK